MSNIKNKEAIQIINALGRLETYNNDQGKTVNYHFAADAVFALGKNIRKLSDVQADIEKARQKIVKAVLKEGEKEIPLGDARLDALTDEIIKLYDADSGFTPHKFKPASLRLESNPVPAAIIAAIDPLFDEAP